MRVTTLNYLNKSNINIRTPLQLSEEGEGYFLSNKTTIDALLDDIIGALSTRVGERVMRPNFGSYLYDYVFEQDNELLRSKVEQEVRRVISSNFGNVLIERIEVLTYEDDPAAPVNGYRVKIVPKIAELFNWEFEDIVLDFSV